MSHYLHGYHPDPSPSPRACITATVSQLVSLLQSLAPIALPQHNSPNNLLKLSITSHHSFAHNLPMASHFTQEPWSLQWPTSSLIRCDLLPLSSGSSPTGLHAVRLAQRISHFDVYQNGLESLLRYRLLNHTLRGF